MSEPTVTPAAEPAAPRIPLAEDYGPEVVRWAVRLVLHQHALYRFRHWGKRDELLEELGLTHLQGAERKPQAVARALKEVEARLGPDSEPAVQLFSPTLRQLAALLRLSDTEQALLRLVVAMHEVGMLRWCADLLESQSGNRLHETLAHVLAVTPTEVRAALKPDRPLIQAGLIALKPGPRDLPDKLDPLEGLAELLTGDRGDLFTLFDAYFRMAPAAQLSLDDYPHLREDLGVLRRCLRSAVGERTPGINVLIHGRPGTGKTEFVRALAVDLGVPLYEVSSEDEDGDGKSKRQRFRAYQLCQQLLAPSGSSLILFDEMEDVFPRPIPWLWDDAAPSGSQKAWTNQLLETNPIPTVWLSNAVSQIDPAFLRRFTYSLELRVPPLSVRRRIVEKHLQGLPVSPAWIERAAKQERLTPAQIAQACRVARAAAVQNSQEAEQLLEQVISRSLEVMGLPGQWPVPGADILPPYDLRFLNPSLDLAAVTVGLAQRPRGRLCLYGPPGSGKTAYARHVAERLDRPLLSKRASDLLSMWAGGTEKLLAEMFREAAAEGAVLLLDEADSFLQDRQGAQRSWEITQVNELLVQMEAFQGLFICSTNLMERLDPAVLRRFDLKVRFGYLRADQAWALVRETLAQHGAGELSPAAAETCRRRLAALTTVTPGDVATALRQARLLGQALTPEGLLGALEEECRAKLQGRKPVTGFTA